MKRLNKAALHYKNNTNTQKYTGVFNSSANKLLYTIRLRPPRFVSTSSKVILLYLLNRHLNMIK